MLPYFTLLGVKWIVYKERKAFSIILYFIDSPWIEHNSFKVALLYWNFCVCGSLTVSVFGSWVHSEIPLVFPLLFVSPGLITVAAFNILLAYKHKLPTEKSLGYSVLPLRVRLVELCLKAMSYHSAFRQCFQISPLEGCSLLINSSSNSPGHEHWHPSRIPLWNELECGGDKGERKLAPHSHTDHTP